MRAVQYLAMRFPRESLVSTFSVRARGRVDAPDTRRVAVFAARHVGTRFPIIGNETLFVAVALRMRVSRDGRWMVVRGSGVNAGPHVAQALSTLLYGAPHVLSHEAL